MANVAVIYGTGEGQTARIAERIADVLGRRDHDVTLVHAKHPPADFSVGDVDAAIVGASVHGGGHQRYVERFVSEHRGLLDDRPSAFFSVSLTAAGEDEESRRTAADLARGFLDETGWEPDLVQTFAGALRYSEYGLLTRLVMRYIARREGGDTDTSRDYEYTDWDAVTAFAEEFAALVGERVAARSADE